jgi:DNA-binding response OmpR family regulator
MLPATRGFGYGWGDSARTGCWLSSPMGSASNLRCVTQVLLATDADWLYDEVSAALCEPGTTVSRIREGRDVGTAVTQLNPDLVVLDLQIGTKGGVAACIDLRHDIAMGRAEPTKVMMLLDRDADRWIARQADADGWLIKPLDAFRLRRAALACLAGEDTFEGEAIVKAQPDAAADEGTEADDSVDASSEETATENG